MTRFTHLRTIPAAALLGLALALPALHLAPVPAPQTAQAAPDLGASPLRGHWKNIDPQAHDILYLRIGAAGGVLRLDIWGVCHPTACYWGPQTLTAGDDMTNGGAIYHLGYADRVVKLYVSHDQTRLHLQSHIHFLDGSGRADYDREDTFVRVTATPGQG